MNHKNYWGKAIHMSNHSTITHSEFYRTRRPEYFSDSETIYEIKLPKEQLAFEIEKISTNQKQDEFEVLCRGMVEKLIAPNLIPQVGPTGGGDGKTDSETYPVSTHTSDRWLVPENGWKKDEKWAFAFSAKKDWKSKLKSDVKKIVGTKRDYTKVYFVTNQTPSSKKKKDAQDDLVEKYSIDIIILDGVWILENIYSNNLIELVVNALNLSDIYINKKVIHGAKDSSRQKRLEELEENINNTNRYFEYDLQLVEDALEAAILSRMLERSRTQVEGMFARALRFGEKIDNHKQLLRIHYQKGWTFLNWYDDYSYFIEEFKNFKKYLPEQPNIEQIEQYVTLYNLLVPLTKKGKCSLPESQIDIVKEYDILYVMLNKIGKYEESPCLALTAKTYTAIIEIIGLISTNGSTMKQLRDLASYISSSQGLLEYPFEAFKNILEEMGNIFADNREYDKLIDIIALATEQRYSELNSGHIFLKRGIQKLNAGIFTDSIVFLGKAIIKLAKDESQYDMYVTLKALAFAYQELGLLWAANNCLISAMTISTKEFDNKGAISEQMCACSELLTQNELYLGRVPSFLAWHELFIIFFRQVDYASNDEEIPPDILMDFCLANRILNTSGKERVFALLPDSFCAQELPYSFKAALYKLGHVDIIQLDDFVTEGLNSEQPIDDFFEKLAIQPCRDQMVNETNFMSENNSCLNSTILGCTFSLRFKKNIELLLFSEMLLAFFESFLATSIINIFPKTESIVIDIKEYSDEKPITYKTTDTSSRYIMMVSASHFLKADKSILWSCIIEFMGNLLTSNFYIKEEYLQQLFLKEEVNERVSLVFEHVNFVKTILGNSPKFWQDDWISQANKKYTMKRDKSINYPAEEKARKGKRDIKNKNNLNNVAHNRLKTVTIIDDAMWNKALWRGFGFFVHPKGFFVFIAFENGDMGKKIFDGWIKKVGHDDKDEIIRITLIKGIDNNNPFWYRVHITNNPDCFNNSNGSKKYFSSFSRIHTMNAETPSNLEMLLSTYNTINKFYICPALVIDGGKNIKEDLDRGILKRKLYVRNAWEIGENDLDGVAIQKGDTPIIPEGVEDAPVLKLLEKLNK
jgi:hypothetical protein